MSKFELLCLSLNLFVLTSGTIHSQIITEYNMSNSTSIKLIIIQSSIFMFLQNRFFSIYREISLFFSTFLSDIVTYSNHEKLIKANMSWIIELESYCFITFSQIFIPSIKLEKKLLTCCGLYIR